MEKSSDTALTRRTFVVGGTAAAAAAGFALAGCSSESSNSSTSGDSTSSTSSSNALTAACAYSSTNVNPVGNSSALMLAATWHVFEGLYDLDLHDYSVYPALADGDPVQISETEYEVTLREGALYSDGTEVTVDDVVNAFEQNMANDTYGAFLEFIESVSAKDDTTITFTLNYPFESLLTARLSVVKIFPASLSEDDLATMPIGSGPWAYKSVNGDDGGQIVFTPNENYTGDYTATADSMTWNVQLDNTSRVTALQEGTVQVMESVPDDNADQLISAGATVEYLQGFNQAFLMFNTRKAPFNDYRVRQAFFYAIDYDTLIQNGLDGHASMVTGFLTEDHKNYHEAETQYTYDPDYAAELLAEAGVSSIDCELLVNNNWVSGLAAMIQQNLAAVGINVTITEESIQWSELAPNEDGSELPFDVMLTPGDPTCFGNDPDLLMSWWYGDNVWTRGRSCWADTDEWAELQTLLQSARESSDEDEQQELWNQCFDLIAEQVPLYALFHRELATGWQADAITGFEPISTTGLVFLGASPASA